MSRKKKLTKMAREKRSKKLSHSKKSKGLKRNRLRKSTRKLEASSISFAQLLSQLTSKAESRPDKPKQTRRESSSRRQTLLVKVKK